VQDEAGGNEQTLQLVHALAADARFPAFLAALQKMAAKTIPPSALKKTKQRRGGASGTLKRITFEGGDRESGSDGDEGATLRPKPRVSAPVATAAKSVALRSVRGGKKVTLEDEEDVIEDVDAEDGEDFEVLLPVQSCQQLCVAVCHSAWWKQQQRRDCTNARATTRNPKLLLLVVRAPFMCYIVVEGLRTRHECHLHCHWSVAGAQLLAGVEPSLQKSAWY
jgi:hypothetical protein